MVRLPWLPGAAAEAAAAAVAPPHPCCPPLFPPPPPLPAVPRHGAGAPPGLARGRVLQPRKLARRHRPRPAAPPAHRRRRQQQPRRGRAALQQRAQPARHPGGGRGDCRGADVSARQRCNPRRWVGHVSSVLVFIHSVVGAVLPPLAAPFVASHHWFLPVPPSLPPLQTSPPRTCCSPAPPRTRAAGCARCAQGCWAAPKLGGGSAGPTCRRPTGPCVCATRNVDVVEEVVEGGAAPVKGAVHPPQVDALITRSPPLTPPPLFRWLTLASP